MTALPPLDIDPLPAIDLRHLMVLTDDTAILQHAKWATPDLHHGYCTDDTARALIVAAKLSALPEADWVSPDGGLPSANDLVAVTQRYQAFLAYALDPETRRFRNFMQYDRSWLEEVGSEDSHARTVWALGKTIRLAATEGIRDFANELMLKALPAVGDFQHFRPWAYALLGVQEYILCEAGDGGARELRLTLAERLFEIWRQNATPDWPWWEDGLTWGSAKLPHAMLVAASALDRREMAQAALTALRWLLEVQTGQNGRLSIIGNRGWYRRGGRPARFGQQPIEAKALVQACLAAAAVTGDVYWTGQAKRSFQWFQGRNDVGKPLYNAETGGCHDGLEPQGINANQGAESTLAYLLSVLALHHYQRSHDGDLELGPVPDFG